MKALRTRAFRLLLAATLAGTTSAQAQSTVGGFNPPWHFGPMVPLPQGTQSLEVREHDTPVWMDPKGKRRGSLLRSTRLPIFGSRASSAECAKRWFLVGVSAWVCGEAVDYSRDAPGAVAPRAHTNGLPHDYYFVGADGALAYANRSLVGEGIPDSQLEPGFAVALQQTIESNGEKLGYSTNGLWLSLADLVPVRGSAFEGIHARAGESLDVVWVAAANKALWNKPNGKVVRKLGARTALRVLERQHARQVEWLRVGTDEWLRRSDTRSPAVLEVPADLQPNERWIDVDLSSQILQARLGTQVVFSTLVSTGLGVGTNESATPVGEHRIWVKLTTSDMSNVEDNAASQYYAIEAVPWVMFFKAGYALHAAFWHDNFGTRRSHGCINLSPKDAEFLFHWTSPVMPAGWYAVHPTPAEAGTRIRVR